MSSQVCRFFHRLEVCLSSGCRCYYVIWTIKYWLIDQYCYHTLRERERLIRREKNKTNENSSYRKIIFNCHFVNSIVNSQARFLFPFPEAIETNWHLVFHFVLCCFFFFCLFKFALRVKTTCQRWRFDQQQFTILYHCTHTRLLVFNTCQGEKKNREE